MEPDRDVPFGKALMATATLLAIVVLITIGTGCVWIIGTLIQNLL